MDPGLAAGEHGFFTVVPAVAVHVEPVGAKQSRWNADGELLATNHITGACCCGGRTCEAWWLGLLCNAAAAGAPAFPLLLLQRSCSSPLPLQPRCTAA